MLTYIYKLIDPTTLECRYIGKSLNPKNRYYRHLAEAKKEGSKIYLYCWIKNLLNQNTKPIIQIIDLVDDWVFWEKYYIYLYKKEGCNLVNLSDGGEGNSGYIHTQEWKIAQSIKMKGKKPWNTGKKLSEDHRLSIGNGNLNRKVSNETKKKLSTNLINSNKVKRKISEKDIIAIKNSSLKPKELATLYNCDVSFISRIINNKRRMFNN